MHPHLIREWTWLTLLDGGYMTRLPRIDPSTLVIPQAPPKAKRDRYVEEDLRGGVLGEFTTVARVWA